MMTEQEVQEAQKLISAHNSLRYNIARYEQSSGLGMYLVDDDSRTSQPHVGGTVGEQILLLTKALVEVRLRQLGVEPDTRMDRDCFECDGTGRRKL
jgi:hypothetical protein